VTKRLTSSLIILTLLSACVLTGPAPAPVSQAEWWQNAVFYEIFVRSFYDTDEDGIGDFNGITQKLDYLQELGITAIWLMPIHPSPSYHGYDVLNYYNVNPEYGTMADFKRLLDEAHQRDMRIIIDLVINHTSSQHPFFVAANSDPTSPIVIGISGPRQIPGMAGTWATAVITTDSSGKACQTLISTIPK
jgi:alpha-amylase